MVDNNPRKRRNPAATATAPAKRRKGAANQKAPTKSKAAAKPKRVVDIKSLPWKSVELPDMLNDAEGFYGLEEVTGVEVVRNGNSVKFVTAEDPADDSNEFEGFGDEPSGPRESEQDDNDDDGDDGDGDDDDDDDDDKVPSTDPRSKAKAKSKPEPKPDKKDKKQQKQKGTTKNPQHHDNDSRLESNVFTAAGDAAADDAAEDVDMSAWVSLDLSPRIISSLARLKFTKPTDIQAAAIPKVLAGHDVIGKASTGSGKTLAFAIPIVEAWLLKQEEDDPEEEKAPMGLIMSPTRELAHQLTNHIKALCEGLPTAPFVCSVTGGLSVQKQQRQLEKADIVVGTPGRLWEVLSGSKKLMDSFKKVSFLVVDEADRLLTEGSFKEAEEVLNAIDRIEVDEGDDEPELFPRQTLVFSATFNKGLQQKLAGKGRFDLLSDAQSMEYLLKKLSFREEKPKFVDVNPVSQMARGLKEGLVECGAMEKDLYLYSLLLLQPTQRVLVFTNSISAARRLVPMLQNLTLPVHALHSQMPQKARLRAVERFTGAKPGTASILVATDVAARGLDIPGIDVVVHYHVPRAADAYVHRSGRTARASSSGLSVLLCAPDEVVPTRRLIAKVHASAKKSGGAKSSADDFFIRTIDLDRRLVNKLKDRVTLAKKIADAQLAKEKGGKEDSWIKSAAEELGVDYDSDDMEQMGKWGGRGSGRKAKQDEARALSKAEVGAMRAQLKQLLAKRVNAGVSERYIATGNVDMDELLKGAKGDFLGKVDGLDLDD